MKMRGGAQKAYRELYEIIPNRLKQKGEKIPFFRIYVELETFLAEVYDCHCEFQEKFDWYNEPERFKKYFENETDTFEYDLTDESVDLVEVVQNLYKTTGVKQKIDIYGYFEKGLPGWFKPFDYKHCDINRLILNNDKMNEKYVQKMEGAFFTPAKYIKISTKYVENAIRESIEAGYDDYVIIDRCAGVANLESQFNEKIYEHLILGTINDAEVLTANIRLQEKASVDKVDALSEKGVNYYLNKIKEYKIKHDVKKLAIIILENPPYAQVNSNKEGGINSNYQQTWIHTQMKEKKKGGEDLDEQFVFSAFEYYKPFAYIHYGPIKIWKSRHLVEKRVKECYLCDRQYFNASSSAVALIRWSNEDDTACKEIHFKNDMDDDFVVKKVGKTISDLYQDDGKENGVCVIEARNFSFESPRLTGSINSGDKYGKKWVSRENLLFVLPLFCACRDKYSETGVGPDQKKDYRVINTVYRTGDGGTKYQKDAQFLQNCLLFCLCSQYNSCESSSIFWEIADELLSDDMKQNQIYKIYTSLVKSTGINGLKNLENFNKDELGKLWKEHNLYPRVSKLKELLERFAFYSIRPDLLKYELLK